MVGLINAQYAIKDGMVYVLEVNPRASRTVPFVSKATGVPLACLAAAVMSGGIWTTWDSRRSAAALCRGEGSGLPLRQVSRRRHSVLGPEMRSTGEVMGIADSFGMAFAKAQASADGAVAAGRRGVRHRERLRQADRGADRPALPRTGIPDFRDGGHRTVPAGSGVPAERGTQGLRGAAQRIDLMVSGQMQLLVNTPLGKLTQQDDYAMRAGRAASTAFPTRRPCPPPRPRATRSSR